jgi:hypothetical protein
MDAKEVKARLTSPGDYGTHGSIEHPNRFAQLITGRGGRAKCHCGCGKRKTHTGMANGVALMSGCEFAVARWVKDPVAYYRRRSPRLNPAAALVAALLKAEGG